jgi:hypothetical protein
MEGVRKMRKKKEDMIKKNENYIGCQGTVRAV